MTESTSSKVLSRFRSQSKPPVTNGDPAESLHDPHPDTVAFFDRYRALAVENRKQTEKLTEAALEIDKLDNRLQWKDEQLAKVVKQLAVTEKGFAAQKIHFAVTLSNALASRDHAVAAVESAFQRAAAANKAAYEQADATNVSAYNEAIAAVKAAYDPFDEASKAAMAAINEEMKEVGLDTLEGERRPALPPKINDDDLVAPPREGPLA